MKKLGAALLIYLGLVCAAPADNTVGPTNQVICNKTAQLNAGPTTRTEMVPLVAGQTIFICGWHVTNSAAAGTFSFSSGTGTACATGAALLLPVSNVTNTAPSADHISIATMVTPLSSAFCITPSVATISAIVYYSQF